MAILIRSPQDLHNIRNNLTGSYELVNDIDMSSWGNFIPIGATSKEFKGTFDGKGYTIKNLTVGDSLFASLFGYVKEGGIKNLSLENVNINAPAQNNVGALVGYFWNSTSTTKTIENCSLTGIITGNYSVGGLIGTIYMGKVNNCNSHVEVNSYGRAGGLVGNGTGVNSFITNCYSTGKVRGTTTLGGLVGYATPTVTNSYWDIETSGQTISAGGIGKTTSEMKTQSTYTNWDFATTWAINNDYPYLQVFGVPTAPPKVETVTVNSFSVPLETSLSKRNKSTKQLQTFTNAIQTNLERYTMVLRNVSTNLSQIESNATQSHRTVRLGNRNINSFIYPISASVYRESKTIKQLLSHIKPLESNTSVLYPLRNIPIYAYSEVIQNPSAVLEVVNLSKIQVIQNPSEVEVI